MWANEKYWDIDKTLIRRIFLLILLCHLLMNKMGSTNISFEWSIWSGIVHCRVEAKNIQIRGIATHHTWTLRTCSLGTMRRNAVECTTDIFVDHYIIDNWIHKLKNKNSNPPVQSHLPCWEDNSYHAAEVLHQAGGSNLVAGGWLEEIAGVGQLNFVSNWKWFWVLFHCHCQKQFEV